jgi:signal transduction histidine kinase
MGQANEYLIFIVLSSLIMLVFITGIIIFTFQYHKRKLQHEREKLLMNEQHKHDLLNAKLEIHEQTIQDIGREIHDNTGQKLTLASIYAHQLAYEKQYPDIQTKMQHIGTIIDQSLKELRLLSKSLTEYNTDGDELKNLIIAECTQVNALNICDARFTMNESDFKLSNTVKNFVLRIIQEFIQNSLKHAHCKNIILKINYNKLGLEVSAMDDGVGFDGYKSNSDERAGIGLLNMKKRAELIGADYHFESNLKKGTFLELKIPANKLYV